LRIRQAVAGDARGIAEVQVRAWGAAYRGILPDALIDSLTVGARAARWREILAAGASRTSVAFDEDLVVGFCSVFPDARDADLAAGTAEIAALYVDPAAWRRGIGSALLRSGMAVVEGAPLTLWVLEDNVAGRAFYARHGFAPDGARREEHGAGRVRLARPAHRVS